MDQTKKQQVSLPIYEQGVCMMIKEKKLIRN